MIVETYYNSASGASINFTIDFQGIANPGYNRDRGPVGVIAVRTHFEIKSLWQNQVGPASRAGPVPLGSRHLLNSAKGFKMGASLKPPAMSVSECRGVTTIPHAWPHHGTLPLVVHRTLTVHATGRRRELARLARSRQSRHLARDRHPAHLVARAERTLEGCGPRCRRQRPVVWDDRILLTSFRRPAQRSTARIVLPSRRWPASVAQRLFGTAPTDLFAPGGMAVPTPATDGRAVYVLFGTGELAPRLCGQAAMDPVARRGVRTVPQSLGHGCLADPGRRQLYVLVDHWSQSYLLAEQYVTRS